jgi:hypothetical protein
MMHFSYLGTNLKIPSPVEIRLWQHLESHQFQNNEDAERAIHE